MSTKFGIYKKDTEIELVNDDLPDGYPYDDFITVAYRGNGTGIRWLNELAEKLPDNVKVYPLDNTAQGIYTIGDIKREMTEQ